MYKKLLTDLVQQTIGTLIGDLKDTITYQSFGGNVYNPDTRVNVPTLVSYPGVDTSCVKFRVDEKDSSVNVITDEKCLLPGANIPVIPKETDRILKADGTVWEVFRVRGVPGQSLWILFIRKVKPS